MIGEAVIDKYKQDGVDIDAGDAFSKFCDQINRSTYGINPFVKVHDFSQGNFRGPRGFEFINLPPGCIMTGGMDGIGTKVVIITATGKPRLSASNIIAMTAMDITRYGGLPLLFMNTLDVSSIGEVNSDTFAMFQQLMVGLQGIALEHRYVLYNGETAELGKCVGSENENAKMKYNWTGAMLGVYHPDRIILGNTLKTGQKVIVLRDDFRSNGISSVRKSLAMRYGQSWWDNPEAYGDILAAASPSAQYDRFLNRVHGWFDFQTSGQAWEPLIRMHLICHLSGGAFKSKLGEDLLAPQGLSVALDDLFDPPEIMKKCAEWRGMSDEECYTTWNGGQGALVVVDSSDADKFVQAAAYANIEAKVAGEIIEKHDFNVGIKSKFGKHLPNEGWIYYK